jgi:hypothetical protein
LVRTTILATLALTLFAFGCQGRSAQSVEREEEDRPVLESTTSGITGAFNYLFVELPRPLFEQLSGKTALAAAKKMEDPYFPDDRREGIVFLADHDYGRRPPYTDRYKQIAQMDPDYTVRASAVRSLNRARDASATPIFIGALNDKSDLVRLEAAKALANIPDPQAIGPLQQKLSDMNENKDVRIAAAHALRHYKNPNVERALIAALPAREFAIAWQARQSLIAMTGADFRYDPAAWTAQLITKG